MIIFLLLSSSFIVLSFKTKKAEDPQQTMDGGLMDSAWPMYCHDTRHTGRSPYSTTVNPDGVEIWRKKLDGYVDAAPVIDNNEIIYIGGWEFHAIYPNGTLKWKYIVDGVILGAPAIDENGTVYFGTAYANPGSLYALYSNGTLKWEYTAGDTIISSPSIGDDGTIYFGCENKNIYALFPNGTLKWKFSTGQVVLSSPAIAQDETIICGSHDGNLYALYANNGTEKWHYHTNHWIRTSPCIADDGTIYFVSLDEYLYAIYPNGTFKWKTNVGAGTSPTIAQDGTIYAGYTELYAIYPNNGSIKWVFDPGEDRKIRGATPCNSIDGIIYFGTHIGENDGGEIIAVNSDGTERWRKLIAEDWVESAPAIGENGTVYIASNGDTPGGYPDCYLHAFGVDNFTADAHGPYYGIANVPVQFTGSAYKGVKPYEWLWDFGDGNTSTEQNATHIYRHAGNYTVILTVTDSEENVTNDTTWAEIQATNDPPSKPDIDGRTRGEPHQTYPYTFVSIDPDENDVSYYIDWGDDTNTGWIGPFDSGEEITRSHKWDEEGTYTISAKAKDIFDEESEWGYLEVEIPVESNSLILRFLDRFPRAFPILRYLLGMR